MTKQKKTKPGFSARQKTRRQQRGHLQRSALIALFIAAVFCIGATQYNRFPLWYAKTSENFVEWSADHGFAIENVEVTGRKKVPAQFVLQALNVKRGLPILSYNPKMAQEKLAQNPWFRSVHIERRLPDTLFIRVKERTPVARWQVDGKQALIDAQGVVLATENLQEYSSLPIIIGQDARHKLVNLFAILKAEPDIGREVVAATWVGKRRWDLKLQGGMIIKLPAEHPELAFSKMASLHHEENLLKRDLVAIDLRLPGKAVLQPTMRANALIERPNFSDKPDKSKKNI